MVLIHLETAWYTLKGQNCCWLCKSYHLQVPCCCPPAHAGLAGSPDTTAHMMAAHMRCMSQVRWHRPSLHEWRKGTQCALLNQSEGCS